MVNRHVFLEISDVVIEYYSDKKLTKDRAMAACMRKLKPVVPSRYHLFLPSLIDHVRKLIDRVESKCREADKAADAADGSVT